MSDNVYDYLTYSDCCFPSADIAWLIIDDPDLTDHEKHVIDIIKLHKENEVEIIELNGED